MFHHTEKIEIFKPPATNIFHPRLAWMLYYQQVHSVVKVCEKFGISRKTFYKWWNRYSKSGFSQNSLMDESRKPHTSPLATPNNIVKKIVEAKLLTGFGQRRLRNYLIENYNIHLSEHTIWKLLKQNLVNDELSPDNSQDISLIRLPGDEVNLRIFDIKPYLKSFQYVLYNAIDSVTHLNISKIYEEPSSINTHDFLQLIIEKFPFKIKEFIINEHPAFKDLVLPKSGIQLIYQAQTSTENSFIDKFIFTDEVYFFTKHSIFSLSQLVKLYNKYLNEYNNHKMQPSLNNLTPLQKLRTFDDFKGVQYFEPIP